MTDTIEHKASTTGILIAWWIIAANVAVWGVMFIIHTLSAHPVNSSLALNADPQHLQATPWTVVTYMWVHYDMIHLATNMAMLYFLARVCDRIDLSRAILPTFLCGGLAGAAAYVAASYIDQSLVGSGLVGASAGVMSVAVTVMLATPSMSIPMGALGSVRLWWIVGLVIILSGIGALTSSVGGFVAHIAGAAAGGALYLVYKTKSHDPVVDARPILDKVRRSGYHSLTEIERKTLFDLSSNNQHR